MNQTTRHNPHIFSLIALAFMLVFPTIAKAQTRTTITSLSIIGASGDYVIEDDIDATGFTESIASFSGTLTAQAKSDGTFPIISNLSVPIFTTVTNASISNIILKGVNITSGDSNGNTGAIACVASGATRIYNCGILPTAVNRDADGNVTGFSGDSVQGTGDVGGLVGKLDYTSTPKEGARVINCFSYATIKGGATVGGIVGNNTFASKQGDIRTMVMNCMFYGDIANGTTVSPVYGGSNINNLNSGGLTTFNFYAYSQLKTKAVSDDKYNCALAIEERLLTRFELYRELLNSNKRLAAIYASTSSTTVNPEDMAKWVLETADRTNDNPLPYPILKAQRRYPSLINIDADHADQLTLVNGRPSEEDRNKGGKLATLSVTISAPTGWTNAPTDAKLLDVNGNEITTSRTITLNRTDKDFNRFNFNYDKVQLPYYNDYGTKNYTKNKVVTGWKITSITGGTAGTFTEADSWGGYNFADRKCTDKDKYSVSHRVFSQGAYFDVPYGVTAITIEPYWGKAAYVCDQYYDVVYKAESGKKYTAQNVTDFGVQMASNNDGTDMTINGDVQKVYTSIETARTKLSIDDSKTVYDYAVVFVGNVHQVDPLSGANTPYTIMSADLDKDNEPDHSFIFTHYQRQPVSPIRFDFLNVIGCAEAQKPNKATLVQNVSIFNPRGWFEITNTCITHITQFECDNTNYANSTKSPAPVILLGGAIDQITSTQKATTAQLAGHTLYIHVGGNAWFKAFGNGTHSDGTGFTPHIPISVTGGDYETFYLTGTYQPKAGVVADNAECYISGGRFGEAAGAAQEMVKGNVRWQIYDADMENFYGGGINADKAITGDIEMDIINSHVTTYCGGPKFGDMSTKKTVTTRANGCTFGKYFGAGFGGTSYLRLKYFDKSDKDVNWNTWQTEFSNNGVDKDRGKYFNGSSSSTSYGKKGPGVATDFDYEFFVWSSGTIGGRFYVKFATFSMAQTNNVNSTLTKCTINGNFYGGGSLGQVLGTATSVLDSCTVNGNVFGGGYSATIPQIPVRNTGFTQNPNYNKYSGMFEPGILSDTVHFNWVQGTLPSDNTLGIITTDGHHDVITDKNLQTLGQANDVDLTLKGTTVVTGNVYGGGDESATNGNCIVNIQQGAYIQGNVYGGGNEGSVGGNSEVKIQN